MVARGEAVGGAEAERLEAERLETAQLEASLAASTELDDDRPTADAGRQ
jgi:hypothetical protein